jgi:hypothetical protein
MTLPRDQLNVSATGVLSVEEVATFDTTEIVNGILTVTTRDAPDVDRTFVTADGRLTVVEGVGVWLPSLLPPAAWYDPSDISTLFQDAAGTVPVTADGDPVGMILDRSGNARHLTQSTDVQRPTYKTAGGLSWLLFDGSANRLIGSAVSGAIVTVGAAAEATGAAGTPVLMSNIISASDRTVMSLKTTEAIFGYWNGAAYSRISGASSAVPNVLTGEQWRPHHQQRKVGGVPPRRHPET